MADIALNLVTFRADIPAYASKTDQQITDTFNAASMYLPLTNYGWLSDDRREYALYLMTAHLFASACQLGAGGGGVVVSATEGSESTGFAPPPGSTSQLKYWLNSTGYGRQLLALLTIKSAGGMYAAGSRATSNIRKFNGLFTR
jgi:hypothetical protein